MTRMQGYVQQSSPGAASEGSEVGLKLSKAGALVVIDFYTQMVMEGRGFQVRMGTISVPTIGDVALTDTAAEASVDAQTGWTILPCYLNASINLGTGTDQEFALKSVAIVAAAAGATAFAPLNLYIGGPSAATTARAAAAGGVTVTAELATTTRRHWSHGSPVAVGAGNEPTVLKYEPLRPPPIKGPAQFYFQAASTDAGPSYYMNLDWIELPSATL